MRQQSFTDLGATVRRRVRYYHALIALIAVMFAAEMAMHFTHQTWSRWIVAGTAILATFLALGSGLTLTDLGLSRTTTRTGLRWSAVIMAAVVAVIGIGLALPATRELFLNPGYADLHRALLGAFVLIPLQTVLAEELLFRGVMLGAMLRRHSPWFAIIAQALLFGLWHVVSSTGLADGNRGIGDLVGDGIVGTLLGIAGAVVFTGVSGVVFGWLRVRTGSLLPCIALHWAANGAGAVAAALAWQLTG